MIVHQVLHSRFRLVCYALCPLTVHRGTTHLKADLMPISYPGVSRDSLLLCRDCLREYQWTSIAAYCLWINPFVLKKHLFYEPTMSNVSTSPYSWIPISILDPVISSLYRPWLWLPMMDKDSYNSHYLATIQYHFHHPGDLNCDYPHMITMFHNML